MEIKYKDITYNLKIEELTQGQVESFFKSLREDYDTTKVSGVEFQGCSVRVANKLGWIEPMIDVDNARPGLIRKISETISTTIAESLEIDPK